MNIYTGMGLTNPRFGVPGIEQGLYVSEPRKTELGQIKASVSSRLTKDLPLSLILIPNL